uniref:Uncharacterized protein n=1 Tax=Vespula pensylvanica TaxID=30213 RepID=A0A834PA31_VESPE|nr:hypothetical protein H0235_002700 [Vespula pensylvanica]
MESAVVDDRHRLPTAQQETDKLPSVDTRLAASILPFQQNESPGSLEATQNDLFAQPVPTCRDYNFPRHSRSRKRLRVPILSGNC